MCRHFNWIWCLGINHLSYELWCYLIELSLAPATQVTLLLLISIDHSSHRLGEDHQIQLDGIYLYAYIYIPGSWVFVQIFVTKHFWEYQLVQHTFDDQSFTNSLNHIYPYEFGCKGVNLIWFYWMFYDHFSVRSLLAKLGRWWGWLDPRRCCSTFLDLNWWTAFCMPW